MTCPSGTRVNPAQRRFTLGGGGLSLFLAAALLAVALLLATWVIDNPHSGFDTTWAMTIADWDLPGLGPFFDTVAVLSDNWPALFIGTIGVGYLFVVGHRRMATAIGAAGLIVAGVALAADFTLGAWVGRERPLDGATGASFPSGHAFGTTAFFGFAAYLAIRHRLGWRFRLPLLSVATVLVGASGLARIYQGAHWPTDVVAGYLLGVTTLLMLVRVFGWFERLRWLSAPRLGRDLPLVAMPRVRATGSYASVVTLDPETGTAAKVYDPPLIIRALYWLAFQARFPYSGNGNALEAARLRRRLAGLLTRYRFGKELVAPIVSVGCMAGRPLIVSRLIEGEESPKDPEARQFLAEVSELFKDAGLPVWQLNPRNPHAHTNLVRTPVGDHVIIDLESAIVTPLPARGQLRSALRDGNFPAFDDIDFERLERFIAEREQDIAERLGRAGLAELRQTASDTRVAVSAWRADEARLISKLVATIYAVFNLGRLVTTLRRAIAQADEILERFLSSGLDRWLMESRISPGQAARLREELGSRQVHVALRHLAVHLAISAALRFPFGSVARFLWTGGLAVKALWLLVQTGNAAHAQILRIHNPVVMIVALVPGFGAFAYLVSGPLRRAFLIRLAIDQVGLRVPFGVYGASRLDRLVAPRPRGLQPLGTYVSPVPAADPTPCGGHDGSAVCCSTGSSVATGESMSCWCSPERLAEHGLKKLGDARAA